MSAHPSPSAGHAPLWNALPLPRRRVTVLVLDMVGSTRLMRHDEAGTIIRWLGFVAHLQALLPARRGRLVKSLGDGALVVFGGDCAAQAAARATATALELQRAVQQGLHGVLHGGGPAPAAPLLQLRMGLHVGDVFHDVHDVYGHAVNIASRIAGLAAPGEVLGSAELREALAQAGAGATEPAVEDCGERWVKHIDEPLRVFRIGPAQAATSVAASLP